MLTGDVNEAAVDEGGGTSPRHHWPPQVSAPLLAPQRSTSSASKLRMWRPCKGHGQEDQNIDDDDDERGRAQQTLRTGWAATGVGAGPGGRIVTGAEPYEDVEE